MLVTVVIASKTVSDWSVYFWSGSGGRSVISDLYVPRCRPDGDVVVVSRHFLNPCRISSLVMLVLISGSCVVVSACSVCCVVIPMLSVLVGIWMSFSAVVPMMLVILSVVYGVPWAWLKCCLFLVMSLWMISCASVMCSVVLVIGLCAVIDVNPVVRLLLNVSCRL